MSPSSIHYFPVTPPFMVLLFVAFTGLVVLLQFGVITYAYEKMGVGRRYILGILLLSLLGSAINIPLADLPAEDIVIEKAVNFFGVWYAVPAIEHQGRTTLAINLGGAVIPLALSVFLLVKHEIYGEAAIGVAIMAAITYMVARPVPGVGIAIPPLLPPILAAAVALLISRRHAAPLAYLAGSVGCLLGADVFNLYRIRELGAPLVSIGGAGISDGVFLTGILAVLLA
ncbi:MAG: DUF1614 domain-containing protein [Thermoguttaceae bacterium]